MSTALGKTALLAVANGSEDIETVTTLDVLRRAGIKVTSIFIDFQYFTRIVVVFGPSAFSLALSSCWLCKRIRKKPTRFCVWNDVLAWLYS